MPLPRAYPGPPISLCHNFFTASGDYGGFPRLAGNSGILSIGLNSHRRLFIEWIDSPPMILPYGRPAGGPYICLGCEISFIPTLALPCQRLCRIMGEMPSFPRKRESRSLKLLSSLNAWMPASAGMMDYDTVSQGGGNSFSLLYLPFIDHYMPIIHLDVQCGFGGC